MNKLACTVVESIRLCLAGFGELLLPGVCGGCGGAKISAAGLCQACNVRLLSLVSLPYRSQRTHR